MVSHEDTFAYSLPGCQEDNRQPWYSSPGLSTIETIADVFDVVADPTRRDIVRLLHDHPGSGEMSVGELVEALGITQPTVSKHLKVLREAGLVGVREDGQHRYYRFEAGALADLSMWMSEVGQRPSQPRVSPYVDLTFAGRALGGILRDASDRVSAVWGKLQ